VYVVSGDAVYCNRCGSEGPYPRDDQIADGRAWDTWTVELWNRRADVSVFAG
jgi:hypothetical protein